MTFSDFKWGQARCLVGESRVKLFDNLEESDCQWEHQILLSDIWQCGKYISGLSKQTESAMSTRPAVKWKAVRDEWIASCVDSHLDPDSMRYCVIEVFVKLEYWRSWLIAGQDIFLPPPSPRKKKSYLFSWQKMYTMESHLTLLQFRIPGHLKWLFCDSIW